MTSTSLLILRVRAICSLEQFGKIQKSYTSYIFKKRVHFLFQCPEFKTANLKLWQCTFGFGATYPPSSRDERGVYCEHCTRWAACSHRTHMSIRRPRSRSPPVTEKKPARIYRRTGSGCKTLESLTSGTWLRNLLSLVAHPICITPDVMTVTS